MSVLCIRYILCDVSAAYCRVVLWNASTGASACSAQIVPGAREQGCRGALWSGGNRFFFCFFSIFVCVLRDSTATWLTAEQSLGLGKHALGRFPEGVPFFVQQLVRLFHLVVHRRAHLRIGISNKNKRLIKLFVVIFCNASISTDTGLAIKSLTYIHRYVIIWWWWW